jgi:hypothetical protein
MLNEEFFDILYQHLNANQLSGSSVIGHTNHKADSIYVKLSQRHRYWKPFAMLLVSLTIA